MALVLALADEAATLDLGRLLARVLGDVDTPPALLLTGELGSGKTTLVRGLASALPGGEEARVSSPSFNLVNLYPTRPEVAHFDLYRLEAGSLDDDLLDCLLETPGLKVVEWAERLPRDCRPAQALDLELLRREPGREARLSATGSLAEECLQLLRTRLTTEPPDRTGPFPGPSRREGRN
ncbi:MAG: tRNA (adenosine(37)-N6)-threonylcarbamoyltransferase complex ATPase subunit type 1 TsaE [Thermodesulfobacteriota bacterium]